MLFSASKEWTGIVFYNYSKVIRSVILFSKMLAKKVIRSEHISFIKIKDIHNNVTRTICH